MNEEQRDDKIAEFAKVDHHTRRRELAAAGAAAHQHLDKLKQSLKMPNLIAVETTVEPLMKVHRCLERIRVLGLSVAADQSLQKKIFEVWSDGHSCYSSTYTVGFQFTGYGSYCLSFEKDPSGSRLFNNFFRDIANYRVNFHRTIVFVNEDLENNDPANAGNLQRLLLDGDGHTTAPDPNYLANLERMVVAARDWGIVVQVCLFMHHSVANDNPTPENRATTPSPVVLRGTPVQRYKSFYKTNSAFLPMQGNLIDGVVTKLLPYWNVVYEIGNELHLPAGTVTDYTQADLTDWIAWAAARIVARDRGKLITTSTGVKTQNEGEVNVLPSIQFCSFHQGQWTGSINDACNRAKNDYGGKHLVIDDDGGTRHIASVQAWSKLAINQGCRASFNHKGIAPVNAYSPAWLDTPPEADESKPVDALLALLDARRFSNSPCAGG
jgi:hypothetical protein